MAAQTALFELWIQQQILVLIYLVISVISTVTTHVERQITVFWDVTQCSSVAWYKCFVFRFTSSPWRWWQLVHHKTLGTYLPNYSASHPRKANSSVTVFRASYLTVQRGLTYLVSTVLSKRFYISWSKTQMKYKDMIHKKMVQTYKRIFHMVKQNRTDFPYLKANTIKCNLRNI